jgi:peptidoglycan/xylan/chitin deacetylase (PgdA/CDA1 family)
MNDPGNAVLARGRRRPPPLLGASAVVHVAGAAAVIARPSLWPWVLGGLVANHALLMAAGLWPRCQLLGSNWVRLPDAAVALRQVAITIDDGPDPAVTPQLLDILGRHGARASFFCIGERVAAHPRLACEILRRGHQIENHSLRHLHRFSLLGPRGMRAEVQRAQLLIATVTGTAPRFFRAPAGLRNPFLDPVLTQLGLQLASWTRRGFDTVRGQSDQVLTRLLRGLAAGDILLLHDGHTARTASGIPVAVEVLPRLLAAVTAAGLQPVTLREAQC